MPALSIGTGCAAPLISSKGASARRRINKVNLVTHRSVDDLLRARPGGPPPPGDEMVEETWLCPCILQGHVTESIFLPSTQPCVKSDSSARESQQTRCLPGLPRSPSHLALSGSQGRAPAQCKDFLSTFNYTTQPDTCKRLCAVRQVPPRNGIEIFLYFATPVEPGPPCGA